MILNFSLDCDVIKQEVNNNSIEEGVSKQIATSTLKCGDNLPLTPAVMPKIGDEFELTVSYAVSPDNFVIITRNTGGEYCLSLKLDDP